MVAVLVSAAIVMPSPSGTSTAQANFAPVSVSALDQASRLATKVANLARGDHALNRIMTASGGKPQKLDLRMDVLGYDLDAVLQGQSQVPRVTLASIPNDLGRIRETDERKAVFFKAVLPLVLQVNEQILVDRQRLWELSAAKKAGVKLDAVDRLWLAVMADRYGTRRGDIDILLRRHDVVPPSLALAQAATESAWGTSRFVKEGNAIFGQWTFAEDHDGIVPGARADGKTHRIRAFDSLYDSVASYVTNLNKHRAYKEFRAARAEMRIRGQNLDGKRLAATLHRYSERGAAYVDELYAIIDGNDLSLMDRARLSTSGRRDPLI